MRKNWVLATLMLAAVVVAKAEISRVSCQELRRLLLARGLTLGVGLRKGSYGLDYAAQAAGELGNVHRFTMSARW